MPSICHTHAINDINDIYIMTIIICTLQKDIKQKGVDGRRAWAGRVSGGWSGVGPGRDALF